MANNALRTLVYAYKDFDSDSILENKDSCGVFEIEKNNLTMVAVFGIRDILRQEVPDAIK